MWLWVFVFIGIALAGLIMLIGYAVWLAHKSADVMSELTVLGDRTTKILDLLSRIEMPDATSSSWARDERVVTDHDNEFA